MDPKTVLCAFFKGMHKRVNHVSPTPLLAAQCNKGAKCKFSHDLNIERKAEKINLYADARDEEKAKDTMDGWDQEKLEKVIGSKHEKTNVNNPTEIVCKHFIEAVETRKVFLSQTAIYYLLALFLFSFSLSFESLTHSHLILPIPFLNLLLAPYHLYSLAVSSHPFRFSPPPTVRLVLGLPDGRYLQVSPCPSAWLCIAPS